MKATLQHTIIMMFLIWFEFCIAIRIKTDDDDDDFFFFGVVRKMQRFSSLILSGPAQCNGSERMWDLDHKMWCAVRFMFALNTPTAKSGERKNEQYKPRSASSGNRMY